MTAASTRLKQVYNDGSTSLSSEIRLMRSLIISIVLYTCESWTFTAVPQRIIRAMEVRCYREILRISYKYHVTNEEVCTPACNRTTRRPSDHLKRCTLKWYGHVSRSSGLAKTIFHGTVKKGRRQGRQKKRKEDNIMEWAGLEFSKSQRAVENRDKRRELVVKSSVVPKRSSQLRDR